MIIRSISELHPVMRQDAVNFIAEVSRAALPFQLFETYRSPERQEGLPSSSTKAGPWESAHQYGLAFDMAGFVNGKWSWDQSLPWAELKPIALKTGLLMPLRWDLGHVEHPVWKKVRRALG